MTIGERIKELRKNIKMTQLDLAEKLFVSDKTVSKWENNKSEPEINILIKLSELFNVTLDYLIIGNTKLVRLEEISNQEVELNEEMIDISDDLESK